MKEYIEKETARAELIINDELYAADIVKAIPAADVVEVRQIRAFIDRLVAERDKYDLHSMRWEHYDCDRLLIERMLDEMDGGVNNGKID